MLQKYDKILLLSGGIDSMVAWYSLGKPPAVYFDMKHAYAQTEIDFVKRLNPDIIIDKTLNLADQEQPDAFIPMRNMYLCMSASKYAPEIFLGGVLEDRVEDNTDKAFFDFERMIDRYGRRDVKVKSPFREMMKWEVIAWYIGAGHDTSNLYDAVACYSGVPYCGRCRSCFRKWTAFKKNGLPLDFYQQHLKQEYYDKAKAGEFIEKRNSLLLEVLEDDCG